MDLSEAGKLLLKDLGGSTAMVRATPAAMKRWGVDRPESVLHALPEEMGHLLLSLPDSLLDMSEDDLLVEASPTRVDRRVRLQFWDEYESASAKRRPMQLDAVATLAGAPSWESYLTIPRNRPALLAWIMRPPAQYRLQMREAESLGLERLLEIMALPLRDEDTGKVRADVGLLVLQAFKLVDQRVRGAVTQRNLQIHVDAGKAPDGGVPLQGADLDRKLAELEAELAPPPGPPQPRPLGPASPSSAALGGAGGLKTTVDVECDVQ